MRNIAQYPITAEDILDTLTHAISDSAADQNIGGLDTMILMGTKAYYLRYPKKLQEVADSMNVHGKMNTGCFGGDI